MLRREFIDLNDLILISERCCQLAMLVPIELGDCEMIDFETKLLHINKNDLILSYS